MIISEHTEERIIELMERGAVLCFHRRGFYYWGEWEQYVTHVTLTLNFHQLIVSPPIADVHSYTDDGDPRTYIFRDEAGRAARRLCEQISERKDVRDDYLPGSRGDWDSHWVERYVHRSKPQPRWVTEQWDFDEFGNRV